MHLHYLRTVLRQANFKEGKVKPTAGQLAEPDLAVATANVDDADNQLRDMQASLSEDPRDLEVLIASYPGLTLDVSPDFVLLRRLPEVNMKDLEIRRMI